MKRFFNILFTVIVLLGILALIVMMTMRQRDMQVQEIKIKLQYSGSDIFLTENYIRNVINQVDDSIKFKKIKEIDIPAIEARIGANSYIDYVNVYSTIEGNIIVKIIQRQPLFRVENGKQKFYVDSNGNIMPLHWKHTSRVPIVNGHFKALDIKKEENISEDNNSRIYSVYNVMKYINNDNFLRAQVEQLYVNKEGDIELIPKVGKHIIVFGDANQIPEKFEKLMLFYEQGIPQSGWNSYKKIDLKYKGQVVCTKK